MTEKTITVDVKEANEAACSESLTTPTPSKMQFNANAVEFVPGQFRAATTGPNPAAPVFTPQFQLTSNGYIPINPYAMPYYMYVPTNGGTNPDGTVVVSPVLTYQASAGYVPRGKGGLSRHNSAGARSTRSESGVRGNKPFKAARDEPKPVEEPEAPVIKMEDFPSVLGTSKSGEEKEEANKPSWAAIAKKTSTAAASEPVKTAAPTVVTEAPEEPKPMEATVLIVKAASSVGSPKVEPREPSASAVPASGKPKLAPWAKPVAVEEDVEEPIVEETPVAAEVTVAAEEEQTPKAVTEIISDPESAAAEEDHHEPSRPSEEVSPVVVANVSIELMKRLRYHESCRPTADDRSVIPNGLLRQRLGTGAAETDDWRAEAAAFAAKGRQSGRRMNRSVSKIEISPEMLIPSENSWSAAQQGGMIDEDVRVGRKIFAVLNKLTIEKFSKLSDQLFTECGISKPTHIVTLVKYLFQKATNQHHFIPMYADLCTRCLSWLGSDQAPEDLVKSIGPGERSTAAADIFRRVLLERCQAAFYSFFLTHEDAPQEQPPLESSSPAGDDEERLKHRLSMLGTVKFVAQLLERRLMTRAVFRNCLEILLNPDERTDDHIECACVFLTEIGKLFEEQAGQGPDAYSKSLQDAIDELTEMAEEEATSARIRFLVMNLIDLRSNKYVNKTIVGQAAGPTKISEVHKQAAKEEQLVRSASKLSRTQSNAAMPQQQLNDDEWETVPSAAKKIAALVAAATPLPRTETTRQPNPWKRSVSSSSSE